MRDRNCNTVAMGDNTTMGDITTTSVPPGSLSPEPPGDSPASSRTCDMYKFILSTCVTGSLFVFGMTGNVLSIVVLDRLRRVSKEGAANLVMAAVLVTDILVLLSLTLMKAVPSLCSFTGICGRFFSVYPYLLAWGWPSATVAHTLSMAMTVLLTVHRYIAVCHPHKARLWCTPTKTRVHIIVLVLVAVITQLPLYFDHYLARGRDPVTNSTVLYWAYTDLGHSRLYQILYKITFYYVCVYLVPLTLLIVLTVFLIRALKRAQRFRQDSASSQTRTSTSDINNILVSVVVLYLLCQPWEPVRRVIEAVYPGQPQCGQLRFYFDELPALLSVVNSSLNFVIYVALGRQIRRMLWGLFRCSEERPAVSDSHDGTGETDLEMSGGNGDRV